MAAAICERCEELLSEYRDTVALRSKRAREWPQLELAASLTSLTASGRALMPHIRGAWRCVNVFSGISNRILRKRQPHLAADKDTSVR